MKPIRTDEDHAEAVAEIERLWGAEFGSPEGDKLEVLAILVEDYERKRWGDIAKPSPLEMLRFVMEHGGRTQADLSRVIGSRSRASEILSGKRELSKTHIRLIADAWHVPVGSLI